MKDHLLSRCHPPSAAGEEEVLQRVERGAARRRSSRQKGRRATRGEKSSIWEEISSYNLKSNETGISAYFTERMLNTGD